MYKGHPLASVHPFSPLSAALGYLPPSARPAIAGRADGGKYPSAALKGENGWTEASGCPLYTNDDFPLSVQQMEDIFAKHPIGCLAKISSICCTERGKSSFVYKGHPLASVHPFSPLSAALGYLPPSARPAIAGRADGGKYPSAALKGENGWTEASGCPLYTNDDFPLSVQQMEDIFAKHPNLTAFVPTGGFPQFVSKAFRRVTEKHKDRISSMKTAVVIADTLPMQMEDLAAGRTHGQVGQQPYMMGYKAMYVLKDIVDGKALKYDNTSNNAIYTGLDVCMKPNIATCIAG